MALSPGNHGVIVTHGIGDNMKPGNLLADFTNYLCDALMESPGEGGDPGIRREADLSEDPPSVTLQIKSPGGEKATWVCKEAFWGDAFPPPKASTVLWWLLTKNLFNQIKYVWDGIRKDPANDETFIPEQDKRIEEKRHPGPPDWAAKTDQKSSYILLILKSASTLIWTIPVAVIIYLFLFLIWICQFLPSIGPLEKVLKWIHKFDPFLSNCLGDVQKYIEHGVWSANARARLEKVLIDMLNDQFGSVNDITIVAHSMGCVVTYDALAEGGKVAEEIKRLESKGKSKKITFISVGSGINQVFRLAKKSNLYAQKQFERPLAKEVTGYETTPGKESKPLESKFFWLDIYARRDPVPAGDLDDDIIEQAKVDPERQVKRRKVINKDNIALDHTSYWENKDIVIPRIARAINGGTEYPWPEAGITPKKLSHRAKYATRLGRLTKIVISIVIVGCVVLVLRLAGIL
jgi:hypothetical protein